jgi:hypothetical protein
MRRRARAMGTVRVTEPVRFPATCGDLVDAYPPSYDAVCPVHGPVRVLTALTDPDNFRATWVRKEDERDD